MRPRRCCSQRPRWPRFPPDRLKPRPAGGPRHACLTSTTAGSPKLNPSFRTASAGPSSNSKAPARRSASCALSGRRARRGCWSAGARISRPAINYANGRPRWSGPCCWQESRPTGKASNRANRPCGESRSGSMTGGSSNISSAEPPRPTRARSSSRSSSRSTSTPGRWRCGRRTPAWTSPSRPGRPAAWATAPHRRRSTH